ncbi:putative membrane protein [Clostridium bornimense]|uniref:Putative membrane protein n=1 Tax=Clostridium bornimense TaxID=1216932 RepID=W6SE46_9CLOT|nr:hypothetical protein [Clostridium bornimense]CDM67890.1 putative membrane protein [Clostridium bornimense]
MISSAASIILFLLWIIYLGLLAYTIYKVYPLKSKGSYSKKIVKEVIIIAGLQILIFVLWIIFYYFITNLAMVFLLTILDMVLVLNMILTVEKLDYDPLNSYIPYLYSFSIISIIVYWLWIMNL